MNPSCRSALRFRLATPLALFLLVGAGAPMASATNSRPDPGRVNRVSSASLKGRRVMGIHDLPKRTADSSINKAH